MNETLIFNVPGMSCAHCETAVRFEVDKLANVSAVSVDLGSKDVVVTGAALDSAAIIAAIDDAGYEAVLTP